MNNNHCNRLTAHLQLNILYIEGFGGEIGGKETNGET